MLNIPSFFDDDTKLFISLLFTIPQGTCKEGSKPIVAESQESFNRNSVKCRKNPRPGSGLIHRQLAV